MCPGDSGWLSGFASPASHDDDDDDDDIGHCPSCCPPEDSKMADAVAQIDAQRCIEAAVHPWLAGGRYVCRAIRACDDFKEKNHATDDDDDTRHGP